MRQQLQLNLQDHSEYLHNELQVIDPLLTTAREGSTRNAFRSTSGVSGSLGMKTSPFSKTAKPGDGKWVNANTSVQNAKDSQTSASPTHKRSFLSTSKWTESTSADLFHRSHMHGFPGIKSKYHTSKKDRDASRGRDAGPKASAAELDQDSLDIGKQTSQQVYFEDEVRAAQDGSREALPQQMEKLNARKMKILKTPKVNVDKIGNGRQSVDTQQSLAT